MSSAVRFPLHLKRFAFGEQQLQLLVPDEAAIKTAYEKGEIDFPYWAKVWPSAIALANFIAQHPQLVQSKTVLELGAGLGLPSLVAAKYAKQVSCTDASEDAVEVIAQSIKLNGIINMQAAVMDWAVVPPQTVADVILLSDVNYAPQAFINLLKTVNRFLTGGSTIILATPQRLMAKSFIEPLLQHVVHQQLMPVAGEQTEILVMVLKQ